MPRKTRKEKIIADLRRKVQKLSVAPADHTIAYKPKKEIVASVSPVVRHVPKASVTMHADKLNADAMMIRRDLKKTFIISTLAIVAEFVLYLATK